MQTTPNCLIDLHIALLSWIWVNMTFSLSYTVAICICHKWQINLKSYFILCGYVLWFLHFKGVDINSISDVSIRTLMNVWCRIAVDYKATYIVHFYYLLYYLHLIYVQLIYWLCYCYRVGVLHWIEHMMVAIVK